MLSFRATLIQYMAKWWWKHSPPHDSSTSHDDLPIHHRSNIFKCFRVFAKKLQARRGELGTRRSSLSEFQTLQLTPFNNQNKLSIIKVIATLTDIQLSIFLIARIVPYTRSRVSQHLTLTRIKLFFFGTSLWQIISATMEVVEWIILLLAEFVGSKMIRCKVFIFGLCCLFEICVDSSSDLSCLIRRRVRRWKIRK